VNDPGLYMSKAKNFEEKRKVSYVFHQNRILLKTSAGVKARVESGQIWRHSLSLAFYSL
jgi:hypothetical protein